MRPKNPARHTVSILTGRKKTSFSYLCISVIPYPIGIRFTAVFPASYGRPYSEFEGNRASHFRDTRSQSLGISCFFFFVISHTCKNCYKTQARTLILLKFGTEKGSPKANPIIKFDANSMNGLGFMTNYSRKTRSFYCHAYRVNRFMKCAENRFVDRSTIAGVPFGGLKAIEIKITVI